jgi:hypothetical protein
MPTSIIPPRNTVGNLVGILLFLHFFNLSIIFVDKTQQVENLNPLTTIVLPSHSNSLSAATLDTFLSLESQKWNVLVIICTLNGENRGSTWAGTTDLSSFIRSYSNNNRIQFYSSISAEECYSSEVLRLINTRLAVIVSEGRRYKNNFIDVIHSDMNEEADVLVYHEREAPPFKSPSWNAAPKNTVAFLVNKLKDAPLKAEIGSKSLLKMNLFWLCVRLQCVFARPKIYSEIRFNKTSIRQRSLEQLSKRKELSSLQTYPDENSITKALWEREQPQDYPFVINETEDPYFGQNTAGLIKSLQLAWKQGCFRQQSTNKIHVIFRANTVPLTSLYIQFNLEQQESDLFSEDYRQKLQNALQVWDFSIIGTQKLKDSLNLRNVFNIPTRVTYDANNPPIQCKQNNGQLEKIRAGMHVYEDDGCYSRYEVDYDASVIRRMKQLSRYQSPCGGGQQNCTESNAARFYLNADVVLYGYLHCSFNNTREGTCDKLRQAGIKTTCVHQVFGDLLNILVCSAKIVVVDHFFKSSSLETHRIDALLMAKKIVIATPSSDAVLDDQYSDFIIFSKREHLVETVRRVLNELDFWENLVEMQYSNYLAFAKNIGSLCRAMKQM